MISDPTLLYHTWEGYFVLAVCAINFGLVIRIIREEILRD